ncbi:hypothetical protein GCM10022419_005860 [Nonomuraea rosea]|uniref:Uncharacterized protein n=1 Tax=Nonomuraea rosea TaxID=638574 RepID=A0ABP6V9A2_9ACTN
MASGDDLPSEQREFGTPVPPITIADEEPDRRNVGGDGQLRSKRGFRLIESLRLQAMGNSQMRNDLRELPTVGRHFRPPRHNSLSQRTKRLVRRRREVQHARKTPAPIEPNRERAMPTEQTPKLVDHSSIDAIRVQKRHKHRHMRGNTGQGGRIETPPPGLHHRLGLLHHRQQSRLTYAVPS